MHDERDSQQRQGVRPSDAETLVGETATSEPLTDTPGIQPAEVDSRRTQGTTPRGEPGEED